MNPKVLHLTLYLDIGGLERMILVLGREQMAAGWDPYVFVYERDTGDLLPQFERAGIPVEFFRKGPGFSFRLLFQIRRHLRRHGITLIHSHDLGALIYASLVKLLSGGRVRVVHTQHSFQHLHSRKARLYERVFPWFADRVVCVSEALRRTYLELGQPLRRLRIVPNGVDFSGEPPSAEEKTELRRRLLAQHALPEHLLSRPWVITLGRLAPVKGPQHALALWNHVPPDLAAGAALIFVGPEAEAGMEERLRAAAEREVHFAGPTLDPAAWLRAADLFLSASEFEGLPLAGLEACAARLPMLLSDIPGHALFRGWAAYFPLPQPATGAARLAAFLRTGSLGPETGTPAARARLETGSGAHRMAERYLAVYAEVLSPGNP